MSASEQDWGPHGWNVEQILVYIWQLIGEDTSAEEYPYERFAQSNGGRRLRIELEALLVCKLEEQSQRERELYEKAHSELIKRYEDKIEEVKREARLEEARWWHSQFSDDLMSEPEFVGRIAELTQEPAEPGGGKCGTMG